MVSMPEFDIDKSRVADTLAEAVRVIVANTSVVDLTSIVEGFKYGEHGAVHGSVWGVRDYFREGGECASPETYGIGLVLGHLANLPEGVTA